MKKVLAFLFICLSCTMMFAQTHWTSTDAPDYEGNYMVIAAVIMIDGVEQFNDNLELAVFVDEENGACRGVKYPPRTLPNGRKYYSTSVFGQTGETYTYKLYDHATEQELPYEVVFTEDYPQLSFVGDGSFGALRTPWEVYFVSGATEPITKDIIGYNAEGGGWYLLSSPVGALQNANLVDNMVTGNFDLYYFDQTGDDEGNEWINY